MTGSSKRNADRQRQRAAARERIVGDEDWHGTTGGYTNHLCRCDGCTTAYRDYSNMWRSDPVVAERRRANQRRTSKQPHRMAAVRARTYGLTREQLAELLAPGRCSACGTTDAGFHGFAIDHDHACCPGKTACGECVRGVLCRPCNVALGVVNDDLTRLSSLIEYLEQWSARASQ